MGSDGLCDDCGCVRIAQSSYGNIRVCPTGGVYLTFGRVTVFFDTIQDFEAASERTLAEWRALEKGEGFVVRYDDLAMTLDWPSSAAFAQLVRQALSEIAWVRGECTFSDEDFSRLVERHRTDPGEPSA